MADTEQSISKTPVIDIERIRAYAEQVSDKGFSWVYRAEGEIDPKHVSGDQALIGTWFTPSFELARGHLRKLADKGVPNPHFVAIVVPNTILEERSDVDKGMNQVVVGFRTLSNTIPVEEEIIEPATADLYINQILTKERRENSKTIPE